MYLEIQIEKRKKEKKKKTTDNTHTKNTTQKTKRNKKESEYNREYKTPIINSIQYNSILHPTTNPNSKYKKHPTLPIHFTLIQTPNIQKING